jgi:hypothetical protein
MTGGGDAEVGGDGVGVAVTMTTLGALQLLGVTGDTTGRTLRHTSLWKSLYCSATMIWHLDATELETPWARSSAQMHRKSAGLQLLSARDWKTMACWVGLVVS